MFLLSFVLVCTVVWLFLKYVYSYWDRKGFPELKATIPFGNLAAAAKREVSFGVAIHNLYMSTTKPFVGIYLFFRPTILIRDVKLVKNILTKDFNSFHDRGVFVDEDDPIQGNLFGLTGSKWKSLRAKLTPAFSSGKLKNMFVTIEETGKSLQDYVDETLPEEGDALEVKELFTRYAIDIIASVIFGLENNSFKNPNSDFFKFAKRFISNKGIIVNFLGLITFLCPSLAKLIPKFMTPDQNEVGIFMMEIVKKTIEHREKYKVKRNDLMQYLIQLRNTGKLDLDDAPWDNESVAENLKSMSIEQCAAQLFVFFVAGFETTSSTMVFCIYELTQNKELMEKVKADIDQTLEKHGGKLSYECVQDMKYLDLCIMETLRKYPGLPILNRICTEDYPIPGTDYVIEKDTAIVIPLMGIQRDPAYFPNPLKFDPERFAGDNKPAEDAYFPFGDGPRACIAVRLGKLNAKVGIVMMLQKFNFECTVKKEMEFAKASVGLTPKDGCYLKITRRKN